MYIAWLDKGKYLIPLGFSLPFPFWWMIDEQEWYSEIVGMIWYTIWFSCTVLLWESCVHVHDVCMCESCSYVCDEFDEKIMQIYD